MALSDVIKLSDVNPDAFPVYWFDIATADHFWFKARLAAFQKLIKKVGISTKEPAKILEIGCGNGLVREQLENVSAWVIDGSDIQMQALQENPVLRGKTYLYNIHDRLPQMEGAYDGVILFDVLEHIPDTSTFLDSVLFHVKPGGWLIINVPAINKLRGHYDEIVGHIRRYDKKMMAAEFANKPVIIRLQHYWALGLVPLLFLRELITPKTLDAETVIKKGMKPPSELVNNLMGMALSVESKILPSPPIGASLLTCVRKS